MNNSLLKIGSPASRFDGEKKVRGEEKYAIDYYMENMLLAGVRRAGVPHGRIKKIDIRDAMKLPGVFKILTAQDIAGPNRHGIVHRDMPVLADDKVRYSGDPVALVIAENKHVLKKAIDLVRVEIEPLPGVFDIESAMKEHASLVHEGNKNGNILLKATIKKGDALKAFNDCDIILEETFETPVQCHGFLETENGIAWQEEEGRIVMAVSTQSPYRDRFEIGQALGLNIDRLRIISPFLGGAFGGKDGDTVQCLLTLACLNSGGRPVKMCWEREESFQAGYKRHSAHMNYRLGAKSDGTLSGLHCRLYYDTGAYAHLGGEVLELGMEHAGGPYSIPDTLIEGWCVYTNNPIGGAMRSFGVAQVTFAIESLMDRLAKKAGLDPLEVRLKNILRKGDTNCSGVKSFYSNGMEGCLKKLKSHPLWKNRGKWKEKAPLFKKRGVGIASVFNANGYGGKVRDSAIAGVELTEKGKILIYNSVSDMGQGNSGTFVQMAGDILCQDYGNMELVQPDTDHSLPAGSSSAGRTTFTYGNALIKACKDMKEKLINRAGLALFLDNNEGLELAPGKVIHRPGNREISFEKLAGFMSKYDRICINQSLSPVCRDIPDTGKEFFAGFPHVIFSYGAHLAYIETDELTGNIKIEKYLAVTDGGKVINPHIYEQQIHGAIAQSIGYGIMEDLIIKEGIPLNYDFATYIIPTAPDMPHIISIPFKGNEKSGPFGMKGVGEVATNGPLPVISNAILDCLNISLTRGPFTGERVLRELSKKGIVKGDA